MTLKEYRLKRKMTVKKLTEELKTIDPRFTPSTVSYMENGVVEPPERVREYLAKKQIEENEIPLSDAEDIVLRCLTGHSKEDPVTRADLHYWTGLPDRMARKAIEGLRGRGYWIVNGANGGYYITFDPEELKAFTKTERAKALSILKTVNAMHSRLPGQMEMGE